MLEGGFGGGGGMQGDTTLLTGASGSADEGATTLDAMLIGVMNRLEPLMTEWRGRGGTTFQDVRERCEADMKVLNGALHKLGKKIGDTSIAYVNNDEDSAGGVGNAGADAGEITTALTGF